MPALRRKVVYQTASVRTLLLARPRQGQLDGLVLSHGPVRAVELLKDGVDALAGSAGAVGMRALAFNYPLPIFEHGEPDGRKAVDRAEAITGLVSLGSL